MIFDPSWGQAGQSIQQFWQEQWRKSLQALQQMQNFTPVAPASLSGQLGSNPWAAIMDSMSSALPQMTAGLAQTVQFDASKLQELQQEYLQSVQALTDAHNVQAMLSKDKRFSKPEWSANPVAAMAAANYLLGSRMLLAWPKQCRVMTRPAIVCDSRLSNGWPPWLPATFWP